VQNNRQEHNYIAILKSSLDKKINILEQISVKNEEQRKLAMAEKFDLDRFEVIYEEKGKLIAELNLLDSGFQSVFDRVKDTLEKDKETYKEDIIILKNLVKRITELSMEIQASEARNKELMEKSTYNLKQDVKTARATNRAAIDYYHNMARLNVVDPQFLDKKK
jgi:flagellar biosynthesis/type III secretory pathway chaperone